MNRVLYRLLTGLILMLTVCVISAGGDLVIMCPRCSTFHPPKSLCTYDTDSDSATFTRTTLYPQRRLLPETMCAEFKVPTPSYPSPSVTTSEYPPLVELMTSMENIQLSTSQINSVSTLSTDLLPSTASISSSPVSAYVSPTPIETVFYDSSFQIWMSQVQALVQTQSTMLFNPYDLSKIEKVHKEIIGWLNDSAQFQPNGKNSLFDDILLSYMNSGLYLPISSCLKNYPWLKECLEGVDTEKLLDGPRIALLNGYHVLIHFNIYNVFNLYIRVLPPDENTLNLMFKGWWYQMTLDDFCGFLRVLHKIFEEHKPVISLYAFH